MFRSPTARRHLPQSTSENLAEQSLLDIRNSELIEGHSSSNESSPEEAGHRSIKEMVLSVFGISKKESKTVAKENTDYNQLILPQISQHQYDNVCDSLRDNNSSLDNVYENIPDQSTENI